MIHTPWDLQEYRRHLGEALRNEFLGRSLANFAASYPQGRAAAFQGLDFTSLAEGIARVKDAALPRLRELYETFKEHAEASGVSVHLAATAQEANRIIGGIAAAGEVKKVVKAKSMTAEETHLNDFLEAQGLEVIETDLGEWIIQLRREGPSHMVMPAIHLSRGQVAELFSEVTGSPQDPDDIEAMVKVARRELRQAYLSAGMGVTGANFAIAQSGTIALVTNEGNARLVTTLPRIHVALVGLDKLVPDLKTALMILKVLPKNATGQLISSYVTWITGAVEHGGGAKERHIVFLDNGRLALSQDPIFREVLRCIRCGACANVCPVYGLVGGHNYGHVYIGAIGLILTYFFHGKQNARAIVQNCLNCQACKAVCPGGIDLPRLINKVHQLILGQEAKRPGKNRVLRTVLKDRRLFHFLLRRARLAQKPLARGQDMIRHLPLFFGKEHGFRSLPVIAPTPLRDRWSGLVEKVEHPRIKAALFGGCLVDFVYPEQGEALARLVKGRDIRLSYPMGQTCCGLPAAMSAEEDLSREIAASNLAALDPGSYDYIVVLCASCGSHLKENCPRLLAGDPGLAVTAAQLADKVIDFSTFASEVLGIKVRNRAPWGKAAFHAPCHLCRGLNVHAAPREMIQAAGLDYLPLSNEEVCCGFGGSYSLTFPRLSARILNNKLDAVEESGAEYLLTDCPGCVLQLRGGLDKRNSKVRVLHTAEALAKRR